MMVLPVAGAEDAQADQTHFLERTVSASPQLDVPSMAHPTYIK